MINRMNKTTSNAKPPPYPCPPPDIEVPPFCFRNLP
jgi:hypothetical protein